MRGVPLATVAVALVLLLGAAAWWILDVGDPVSRSDVVAPSSGEPGVEAERPETEDATPSPAREAARSDLLATEDPVDWVGQDPAAILEEIRRRARTGLTDGYQPLLYELARQGSEEAVDALLTLLEEDSTDFPFKHELLAVKLLRPEDPRIVEAVSRFVDSLRIRGGDTVTVARGYFRLLAEKAGAEGQRQLATFVAGEDTRLAALATETVNDPGILLGLVTSRLLAPGIRKRIGERLFVYLTAAEVDRVAPLYLSLTDTDEKCSHLVAWRCLARNQQLGPEDRDHLRQVLLPALEVALLDASAEVREAALVPAHAPGLFQGADLIPVLERAVAAEPEPILRRRIQKRLDELLEEQRRQEARRRLIEEAARDDF